MRVIAKKLDMKTRDLLRLNPDVSRNPKVNTVILVPSKNIKTVKSNKDIVDKETIVTKIDTLKTTKVTEVITNKEKQKNLLIATLEKDYKIHLVKKGDTFFSLTRFYNVSREELTVLNPELSEGLKLGQIIKIMPLEDVVEDDDFLYVDEIEEGISLKVAIMLPFRAEELDTLNKNEIFENSRLANITTDLYLGAEIAIDSLRKQGIEINATVFDTGRNSTEIKKIVSENDLDKNDVIIGPLYSEEVQILAENVKIPVVFPVYSKKQSSFTSKRIIKTIPNKKLFRDKLSNYIKENFKDGNLIIVGDGSANSNIHSQQIKTILEAKDSIAIHIITSKDGYIKKEKFTDVLKPNEKNTVVLTTDDAIIVASAINGLISLEEDVTVNVFSFDKNSVFNKIDNLKLAKLGFTYVSDEYIREDSFKTMDFNKKYLSKNGVLPSYYATKGFDVTYDVLIRLASGKSLKSTFKEGFSYRVESKFDYSDKFFKVTENKGLFIVKYNEDLTLTRIE